MLNSRASTLPNHNFAVLHAGVLKLSATGDMLNEMGLCHTMCNVMTVTGLRFENFYEMVK